MGQWVNTKTGEPVDFLNKGGPTLENEVKALQYANAINDWHSIWLIILSQKAATAEQYTWMMSVPRFGRTWSFAIWVFCGLCAHGQTPRVETLTIEQGLSQGFVLGSCQDRDGFLWFGTKNGLNRYDGYDFLVFNNDAYDPHSLSDNQVIDVCDAGELLCVLTEGQINLFHRRTQRFHRLPKVKAMWASPQFWGGSCEAENDHTIWLLLILPDGKYCYRLTWPPDLPARLAQDSAAIGQARLTRMFGDMDLSSICLSADRKTLWLATNTGQLGQKTLPDGPLAMTAVPLPDKWGLGLAPAGNSGVFIGTYRQDALAWYRPARSATAPWKVWRGQPQANGMITLYLDDQQNRLWVFCQSELREYDIGKPFDVLDRANAHFVVPMPDGILNCLRDANGVLWFGTDAKGIRKFNPTTRLFRHLLQNTSVYSRPVADRLGNIWLSDVRNGAINRVYNSRDGSARPYPVLALDLAIRAKVAGAADGTVWLCGQQKGRPQSLLVHYDPASGREDTYICPPRFNFWDCALLVDQAANAVWASDGQQLVRLDVQSKQFSVYSFEALTIDPINPLALEKTADGSIWVATGVGLLRAMPDTGGGYGFHWLKNNPVNRNSLLSNHLKSLLTDPADGMVLWIGTAGNGLCRYDLRNNTFQHYTTRNGLPDDMVYGILAEAVEADGSFNLWLSTNKGLARFNPTKGHFRYFLKYDGLQDNEFNTYAYGKNPNGELMFGGVNGLTIFDPKSISSSASTAEARITALKVNNVLVSPRDASGILSESVEFTPPIVLRHHQNNLHIQFMATDLTQPARNQFRYYLEGAEPEWAHTGFEHSAQYLNLPPGTYAFKVVAANSDGVWNTQATVLHLRILPPWYASPWAYVAYALLFGGGLWFAYRYQLRQKLEHLETARLKELDRFKSRFFANISHEFRTPLTVILGMVERLRQVGISSVTEHAEIIQRNGENLLQLINQILDLSKLESGKLRLHLRQADMVAFSRYLCDTFRSFAEARKVALLFESKTEALWMDFDPEKMQSVLLNLISNAIKFSLEGGQVWLQIAQTNVAGRPFCQIEVRDTGIGIPTDKLGQIFDRFYQVDDSPTRKGEGTGIGLALTKELVQLMGGSISVASQIQEGTTFTLLLPIATQQPLFEGAMPFALADGPAPALSPTQDEAVGAPGKPLLLIVEDNEDLRHYIVACASKDYRVIEAHHGQMGIDRALELVPDLIVSDVMMPEKDGLELCQTLKSDERTSHIPIVLLTARVGVEDRIAGLRRGADAYLAKPFHQQELLLQLHNLAQLRRRLQTRYANLEPPAPTDDPGLLMEDAFLQKFRAYVESQLGNADLSVENMCRAVGMGRTNLHQKISSLTGMSAMQYVRALRLRKAKALLERGDMNVSEVAFEVGFDDPKYFGRVFADETGVPPTQWRKKA